MFATVKPSNYAWLIYGNVATMVVSMEIVYTILGSLVMADASQFPVECQALGCRCGRPQGMDERGHLQ